MTAVCFVPLEPCNARRCRLVIAAAKSDRALECDLSSNLSCQPVLNCLVWLKRRGKELPNLAKHQTLVSTWGRFVLGAFVFAWLNVAAQPCLMAMEMSVEPAIAPAHMDHGSQHVDHGSDHTVDMSEGCGHCPPTGTAAHQGDCMTMQATDCTELPQSNVEARPLKVQLKDIPGLFAMPNAPPRIAYQAMAPLRMPQQCARLKFTDSPPLNIRYCVFLK